MKRKAILIKNAVNGEWYEDYRGKPVLCLKQTDPSTGRYMYGVYEHSANRIFNSGVIVYEKA